MIKPMYQTIMIELSFFESVLYSNSMVSLPQEIRQEIINLLKLLYMRYIKCGYEDWNKELSQSNILSKSKDNREYMNLYSNRLYIHNKKETLFVILSQIHNKLIFGDENINLLYNELQEDKANIYKYDDLFVWDLSNCTLYYKDIITHISQIPFDVNVLFNICFPIKIIDTNGYPRLIIVRRKEIILTNGKFKNVYTKHFVEYIA